MFRMFNPHAMVVGSLLVLGAARADPVWPPASMAKLPPDYLQRLHASLLAGSARLDRMHFSDSEKKDSIGWVRYGQPALLTGAGGRSAEINQFFESEKFEWTANPKFGFSLFG